MANLEHTAANLEKRGFSVRRFATGAEAAAYLNQAIDGKTVGFGGSLTLEQLGLYGLLSSHNEVHWHWINGPQERETARTVQVYVSSVNGLAETGELVNIDGSGNRVSSTLYGHETVYLVIGRNKLADTYDEAVWRARNIAAPKNAQRLGKKTPCALKAGRCYDCQSPERICRALVTLWGPVTGQKTEILLVDEDLGL